MQRHATELRAALATDPRIELRELVLRTSWRWTPVRAVPFLAGLLRAIPAAADRHGSQVVLFSSLVTAGLAVPLRRALHRRGTIMAAVANGQDVTLPNRVYQAWVRRVLGSLDLVLPISRATAEQCVGRGVDPTRMRVVPCAIDVERLTPPADPAAARRELLRMLAASDSPPWEDELLLCSVGRHQERKGFGWFAEQVAPGLPDGVVWLLAGEGPQTGEIRATVARLRLEDRVRLLGRVDEAELATLYRGADVFVMPNVPVAGDMEGFGIVMLEAGLCGLPTLAADLEGIRDVIRPGENGVLLPSGDAAAWLDPIRRFRDDREALAEAGARARGYTVRNFSWQAVIDSYVETLGEAVL
jgi:phosphatidylinositol alpha-1,6-mannosyltransferase